MTARKTLNALVERFDLVVIGTGSGLDVAAAALEQGLSVVVVDRGPLGGTCLNRGCIPSKMLIHCADVMETVQRAADFGIFTQVERVDWSAIVNRVSSEVLPSDLDSRAGFRDPP